MIKWLRLSPRQWRLLSSVSSNISQAIILFSLAALFVPEGVGLSREFSHFLAVLFFLAGLTLLVIATILVQKGKE